MKIHAELHHKSVSKSSKKISKLEASSIKYDPSLEHSFIEKTDLADIFEDPMRPLNVYERLAQPKKLVLKK